MPHLHQFHLVLAEELPILATPRLFYIFLFQSPGPGQAKPKPSQSQCLWLGLEYREAKATSGQAKASGFQAKPSQNKTNHNISLDNLMLHQKGDKVYGLLNVMDLAVGVGVMNRSLEQCTGTMPLMEINLL
jgi:hypothetical protein